MPKPQKSIAIDSEVNDDWIKLLPDYRDKFKVVVEAISKTPKSKNKRVVRLKGGAGSGHQGHQGRPGKRGGSRPGGGTKVYTQAELDRLARLAERKRQRYHEKFSAAAKAKAAQQYKDGLYYNGDPEGKSSEDIYAGSHPDVQKLARETGLLATSKESHEYIQKLQADGKLVDDTQGVSHEQFAQNQVNDITIYSYSSRGTTDSPYQPGSRRAGAEDVTQQADQQLIANHGYDYLVDKTTQGALGEIVRANDNKLLDGVHGQTAAQINTDMDNMRGQFKALGFHDKSLGYDISTNAPSHTYGSVLSNERQVAQAYDMYIEAHKTGKWPVYVDGKVTRYQRMDKTTRAQIETELINDPNMTLAQFDSFNRRMTNSRPNLVRNEETYTPGGGGRQNNGALYSAGTVTGLYGNTYPVAKLRDDFNAATAIAPQLAQSHTNYSMLQLYARSIPAGSTPTRIAIRDAADAAWKLNQVDPYGGKQSSYYDNRPLSNYTPITSSMIDWSSPNWTDQYMAVVRSAVPVGGDKYTTFTALSNVSANTLTSITTNYNSTWDTKNHGRFTGVVNNVFQIHPSRAVLDNFAAAGQKYGNEMSRPTYHGTHYGAARPITSTGFIVPKTAKAGRMMGDGVYLATNSSKSVQYLGSNFGRGSDRGVLLQTRAYMGVTTSYDRMYGKIYDSVRGGREHGLLNEEYAVKDPTAVLPVYWMDISRTNS